MGVNQRRQLHPLHLFEQQRNVVDALRDDVGYLIHAQSLAQSGIYLQIWANRQVYFPVRSNGLKDIGHFIGAKWTSPHASGLQSLVWRHQWEATREATSKDLLLTYNAEDCRALQLLTDELSKIQGAADILSQVEFANQPKRHTTEASA